MTQKTMRNAGSSEMDGLVEHKYEVLFVQHVVVKYVVKAQSKSWTHVQLKFYVLCFMF